MSDDQVRHCIAEALSPGRFFIAPPRRLRFESNQEHLAWEIFLGHLLDPAHAQTRTEFHSWNVFLDDEGVRSSNPLVSVKWEASATRIHVTRQILSYGFEAYEDSPGVILSREVQKWVVEVVGTIDVERLSPDALSQEIARCVFLAVIGTSRLPITSLESPLPAFSLGQLGYSPSLAPDDRPMTEPLAFLAAALLRSQDAVEQAKVLETALRAFQTGEASKCAELLVLHAAQHAQSLEWLSGLFHALFNNVALSPYTQFVDRMVAVLLDLSAYEFIGPARIADVVSYMLRHLCRHLTAFDLTLFHNFGANYPDALFLDALLRAYLGVIDRHPELFRAEPEEIGKTQREKRLRRRALRQAAIVRTSYEGHRVPDAPTSMGENLRVLPEPFARVPEEQIANSGRRTRRLFDSEPLEKLLSEATRALLIESIADLSLDNELRELGMGHFHDRPLGIFKQPGEVDRTPLLSYEAFSRFAAKRRLAQLKSLGWISAQRREELVHLLDALEVGGVSVASLELAERPGVISLADAVKSAPDFKLVRTAKQSAADLLSHYDVHPLQAIDTQLYEWLIAGEASLWIPGPRAATGFVRATITVYDQSLLPRVKVGFGSPEGGLYYQRRGIELVERLEILETYHPSWPDEMILFRDLTSQRVSVPLRQIE